MKKDVKEKREGRRTQWAAQFAVASELCKMGYEISFTMGNTTPVADLIVVSPKLKIPFLIDVKGLYRPNPWQIKPKAMRKNLFYVFAYVPDKEANRFFVMIQKQANHYIEIERKRFNRSKNYPRPGFLWKQGVAHENAWDILPE